MYQIINDTAPIASYACELVMKDVCNLINQGWKVIGPVSIVYNPDIREYTVFQAMVKGE